MAQNPSFRLAIGGSDANRVSNVRSARINAGVPAYKIETVAVGDLQARRDGMVTVLVAS